MAQKFISIEGIAKRFPAPGGGATTVFEDLWLSMQRGDFTCIIGHSGCGKTTVLNILAGLDEPTGGQALLDGRPIARPGPDRAVLFQEPALFPWLSVAGNVDLALKLTGTPASERPDRIRTWLANVGLEAFADVQPHELSAGMRQRAQLARALATEPEVLLGDEPFGALDAQARELLQDEVQRVWLERGGRTTFVFVTHNVREAALLADRVLVMSAAPGRLLEEVRISAPRPRQLDDVLVARVVSDVHELLMREVERARADGSDRPILPQEPDR